ncbi:MAG: hypothetical protein ABII76_00450, partial [Pseudomonadota bacterium]
MRSRDYKRIPTPAEEPDAVVRWRIADRIPAERLQRVPTEAEEPDADVRRWSDERLPAERLHERV